MEEVYNKELFYSHLIYDRMQMLSYERPLTDAHLKPVEEVVFHGQELTPFNTELFAYEEARRYVLDFDIYTLSESYDRYPNVVNLLMDCYRRAAEEGVTEAYNNIGVFYTMIGRVDKALPFFMKAASAGLASGLINLMGYYGMTEDYEHMMDCVEKLVAIGDAAGMWNFALAYHFGYIGRTPDISKAKDMYWRLLTLPVKEDMELSDESEMRMVNIKTITCYNLAKLRLLTESHSEENLRSILNQMEHTPYVLLDRPRSNELKDEIMNLL